MFRLFHCPLCSSQEIDAITPANPDATTSGKASGSDTTSTMTWHYVVDDVTGLPYYWNHLTNEVSWTAPQVRLSSRESYRLMVASRMFVHPCNVDANIRAREC